VLSCAVMASKFHVGPAFPDTDTPPVLLCRGKTNFFEKRVGEYQKSNVMNHQSGSMHAFATDEDF
jgi:hypothetical protein